MERKILTIAKLKMLDDGAGGFEGYPSVFGHLDNGGDIVLPGAFAEMLPEFLKSGFNPDSHQWTYKDLVAYPASAKEDGYGLFCQSRFHSTSDAQDIRTKMRERAEAGLDVQLSIGYDAYGVKFLTPDQYDEELPKVLAPEARDEGLKKAKRFAKIRLLPKLRLYEYSPVPAAMLETAATTGVKTAATGGKVMDVFAKFKAQHIGGYAEVSACMEALMDLRRSLMWNCIEPAVYNWDEMPMEERMGMLKAGLEEFATLTLQVCEALLPMAEAGKAEMPAETGTKAAEALSELPFSTHTDALGAALSGYVERTSWVRELRAKQGREIGQESREKIAGLAAALKTAVEALEPLAAPPAEPVRVGEEILAALDRIAEVEARLAGAPA